MNMLMIDDRIPRAALGAGYPRANALIHALVKHCDRLAFYPLVFPDESADTPYAELDLRVELLMSRGAAHLGATLLESAEAGFDVVWVSRPDNMRSVLRALAAHGGLRERFTLIYDAEALYAPRTVRMHALTGTQLDAASAAKLFDEELWLAGQADIVVSVSAAEAAAVRARVEVPAFVVGFTSVPDPTEPGFAARRDFGFVGGIRPESPNEDALLWYAADMMHELHARTGAALHVAGFIDSPWVLDYGASGLTIHGAVADLRPFFAYIRVFIAPTRFAAGLPQKLIDAASSGVPIVATSILADALDWRHETELLVADDASAFVEASVRLYDDAALWRHLRENALVAVRRGYGTGVFENQLDAVIEVIASMRKIATLLA